MDKFETEEQDNVSEHNTGQVNAKKNIGPLIILAVTLFLLVVAFWQFSGKRSDESLGDAESSNSQTNLRVDIPQLEKKLVEGTVELDFIEPAIEIKAVETAEIVVIKPYLPELNASDLWIKTKLPELTWRAELLKLVIDDDMIRRLVVFTDNFAQGNLSYEHSPFVAPQDKFSVDEAAVIVVDKQNVWSWNKDSTKRFNVYIDLLRSIDSSKLVSWYFELKPLVDQAYGELGYEDDFTLTLQDAIARVLDMELPKSSMAIIRPSVMYKYQDKKLEDLSDSDKLLLRLGKENLLIVKSILLEINEKLGQAKNGIN